MRLEELQWFVTLAETEHVTVAAAELKVSQPTLSRALARLEEQAGTPLFDRVNRRLRLNAYGHIMLEHARRSIAEMHSAGDRIAALLDPDRGRVRLAFLHSLASWYVPEQLRRFRDAVPGIGFELFQGPAHEITQRVLTGQADLAITAPRPDGAGVVWRGLYVERLCLAVPPGHRLATRARTRLSAAAGEPFVALAERYGLRQVTDELCAEEGLVPDIVFEATEIPTMEGLVAAGFGVAVVPVPREDAGPTRSVHVALTNRGAKREVGLVWQRDRPLAPPARRFVDFLAGP
ncbi:LysR family transcriptional regulator [Mycobacterium yunnanensis]|uniref:Probable hydrogen peroxide-inducible genes activator n=1 Tax=Mycobacterium yunnanensis TaxID=368477 RepID=A0A9X2ZCZ0_9MYCO|nr:LysR family transcriptional regulator [Mycobacterium yunnanensis]MCV7424697.1 LysR family transcriptional regulator [Mycobacterium yunnanensis]